jgi:hypothetical protein
MERTTDEIVALGEYCEQLIRDDSFDTLCKEFQLRNAADIMRTEPHETKKREGIYAANRGYDDFIGLMRAYISARDQIIKSDEDASIPVEDDQDDE